MPYTRPLKLGGNTQFVDEVTAGFTTVYANEYDDEFNGIVDWINRPLGNGSVGPPQILPRSITYAQIALATITTAEIAAGTILGSNIAPGTITASLLAPNIVVPIQPSQITNVMLAAGCVTDAKVTSVGWAKITGAPTSYPPSGVAGGDLIGSYPNPTIKAGLIPVTLPPSGPASGDLQGTYPGPTISPGMVTRIKTAPDCWLPPVPQTADVNKVLSVLTGPTLAWAPSPPANLTAGQVSTAFLADAPNGVTTAKINNGAVTDAQIGGVSWGKISGVPVSFFPSGPAGGDLAGTYPNPTIGLLAVTDAKIAGMAYSKLTGAPVIPVIPSALPPSGPAGGALTGAYPNPGVSYSQITGIPTSLPPSGAAGGDLTGTYPNPTLVAAQKNLWTSTATALSPLTATNALAIPGPTASGAGVDQAPLVLGTGTAKTRIQALPGVPGWCGLTTNARYDGANWNPDDATKCGWELNLTAGAPPNDTLGIWRHPVGGGAGQQMVWIDTNGKLACTLADTSVTTTMLAAGAAVRQTIAANANLVTSVPGNSTWTKIAETPAMTIRANAKVLLVSGVAGVAVVSASTSIYLGWGWNGGQTGPSSLISIGAGTYIVPLMLSLIQAFSVAGAYTFSLWVWCNTGAIGMSAQPGWIFASELA